MQDSPAPVAESPFKLSGEQYWSKPLELPHVMDFASELARKTEKGRGLYIDMPSKVYLDKHQDVPLPSLHSNSFANLDRFALRMTAHIVSTHLETGKIAMAKAADTPVRDPNAPDGDSGPGWSVEQLQADAADAVTLPRLGRFAVFLLNGPDASHTLIRSEFPSVAAETASETKAALKALRHEGGSPQPAASIKALKLRHEPLPPLKEGAMPWQLAAAPPGNAGQGGHRVHLGFRIPGLPRFLQPKDKPLLDDDGKRVLATLPVFLIAFDADRTVVLSRHLGLPITAAPGPDPEVPLLSGHVSFDLETLMKPRKPGDKLTLWAVAMDRKAALEVTW